MGSSPSTCWFSASGGRSVTLAASGSSSRPSARSSACTTRTQAYGGPHDLAVGGGRTGGGAGGTSAGQSRARGVEDPESHLPDPLLRPHAPWRRGVRGPVPFLVV